MSEFEVFPRSVNTNLAKSSVRQSDMLNFCSQVALVRIAFVLGGGSPISERFMLFYPGNLDRDGGDTICNY